MKQQLQGRQRGASILLVLIVVAVLAMVGMVGAQAFPTFMEYQAALKAINKVKDGNSIPEIRQNFDKAAQIDDIKSISGKDLEINKPNDKFVVSFAYNKEIHLAGPAYLLLKYQGTTK